MWWILISSTRESRRGAPIKNICQYVQVEQLAHSDSAYLRKFQPHQPRLDSHLLIQYTIKRHPTPQETLYSPIGDTGDTLHDICDQAPATPCNGQHPPQRLPATPTINLHQQHSPSNSLTFHNTPSDHHLRHPNTLHDPSHPIPQSSTAIDTPNKSPSNILRDTFQPHPRSDTKHPKRNPQRHPAQHPPATSVIRHQKYVPFPICKGTCKSKSNINNLAMHSWDNGQIHTYPTFLVLMSVQRISVLAERAVTTINTHSLAPLQEKSISSTSSSNPVPSSLGQSIPDVSRRVESSSSLERVQFRQQLSYIKSLNISLTCPAALSNASALSPMAREKGQSRS